MTIEEAIKQPKFTNEYHKLMVNLLYTASWVDVKHQQFMKSYGITVQQFNVLRILRGQKGNPLSINCLIERMIDKSSNASRIVDKLEQKGYVLRTVCPNDRRQVEVRITDEGNAFIGQLDEPVKSLQQYAHDLNQDEVELMNGFLDKIRNSEITNK
jgi:DNA-binding MarR family transcriptional regulator